MKKTGSICRWAAGILLLLMGMTLCASSVRAGILCLLAGVLTLPIVWKKLREVVRYPRWVAAVVPLVFFFSAMAAVPPTEASSGGTSPTALTDSAKTENMRMTAADSVLQEETPEDLVTPTPDPVNTAAPVPKESTPAGEMTVHFLDVGQGLSIFVQSGGETLIYDGGDRETSSFVVAYLKEQGVTSIDYLISSHYDSDHVAGLIGCLNAFDVKNVISSDYVHDSQTYQSFVDTVEKQGLTMQHPAVGTAFTFGDGSFTILAPAEIDADDSNNNSVAIRLVNGENSFLFTGDAESSSEAQMCRLDMDLSCDVLVPGHHGSATATSWEFLQATVPEYAVISCGSENSYGHPDKDTMDKLEAMEIQVYRTDKQGTIVATSDGTTIQWSQEPCNDYSPGDPEDTGTQAGSETPAAGSGTNAQAAGNGSQSGTQPAGNGTPSQTAENAAQTVGNDTQTSNETGAAESTGQSGGTQPSAEQPAVSEPSDASAGGANTVVEATPAAEEQVWVSATGSKYHKIPDCGNMNPDKARQMTRSQAEAKGLEPCKKCY